jgi:hypothetical protein
MALPRKREGAILAGTVGVSGGSLCHQLRHAEQAGRKTDNEA